MAIRRATLGPIRSHLPEGRLTNEMLEESYPEWNTEAIYRKTGIRTRAVADAGETASDLGVAAAERLFTAGDADRNQIDFVLFCTQSPDYVLPTTACLMQDRLGLKQSCGALDFNLGCSGFVYGLSIARGLVESGDASCVLLITAETYSKYMHETDRSVRTIFSDGASAAVVRAEEATTQLLGPFLFGTDGRGGENLVVRAGGHRIPRCDDTALVKDGGDGILRSDENLYMNGQKIFTFTLSRIPRLVKELLQKSEKTMEDVDYFVFHQANAFMLEHLRDKLSIPEERFCINLEDFGNTVSSTIPMALEKALRDGHTGPSDLIMLVGFGVGYSWAGGMVRLT